MAEGLDKYVNRYQKQSSTKEAPDEMSNEETKPKMN